MSLWLVIFVCRLLGGVLTNDVLDVFDGGFNDLDATQKKLFELACILSHIRIIVLLLDASQVGAKHSEEVVLRLDAHGYLSRVPLNRAVEET